MVIHIRMGEAPYSSPLNSRPLACNFCYVLRNESKYIRFCDLNLRILSKITPHRKTGTEEGNYTKENTHCCPMGLIIRG